MTPVEERIPAVALFVDIDNIGITSLRYFNVWPDYRALFKLAESYGEVVVAEAFARSQSDSEKQARFLARLQSIGYRVRTQTCKIMFDGTLKAAPVDMDLAFRIGQVVSGQRISTVVIASGDSDFAPICREIKRCGVDVIVVGPDRCSSPEIRRAASRFYCISEVGTVGRLTPAHPVAA